MSKNELNAENSLCFTCKHGICGLKLATESIFDVRTAHPVVEDGTFFDENSPAEVDHALAAHNELFGHGENDDDGTKEVESKAHTVKTFIHGICCHPILRKQIDVPEVKQCSGYEEGKIEKK
jgi:hypothetical protein